MKSKRRSTRPVTLLTKIEGLLCDALGELSSAIGELPSVEKSVEKKVRELLVSATASVGAAKDFLTPAFVTETPRKRATSRRGGGRRLRPARSAR
jgi:hypothetical protein